MLECWNAGMVECEGVGLWESPHYSITPLFQHSTTPRLHDR